MKGCEVPDCDQVHYSKGLCKRHYDRKRRRNTLDEAPPRRPRGQCKHPGCERAHYGLGYCQTHWFRFTNYGDPDAVAPRFDYKRLFEEKIARVESGCWLWTGAKSNNGYGRASFPGSLSQAAHRVAYELYVGPVPEGLHLDHLCRVRACVNPAHLEPVTQEENNRRTRGIPHRRSLPTPDPNLTKWCPRCRSEHPLSEFGWNRAMKDGYTEICRAAINRAHQMMVDRRRAEAAEVSP